MAFRPESSTTPPNSLEQPFKGTGSNSSQWLEQKATLGCTGWRQGLRLYMYCLGLGVAFLLAFVPFNAITFPKTEGNTSPSVREKKSSEHVEHFVLGNSDATMRKLPGNKIFMTGPWVPSYLLQPNPIQEPNMEVHVFNNTAMALSVKLIDMELREKAGLYGAWEAWATLRPWAFRADLWRYMILWSEGGIYVDSKIRIIAPLITWAGLLAEEELSVCQDSDLRYKSKLSPNEEPIQALWNGAISARNGSPVLLEAIRASISNVLNRTYVLPYFDPTDLGVHGDLSITGPILMGYAARYGVRKGNVRVPCAYRRGKVGITTDGHFTLFEKDESEHSKVREAGNKYGELYGQKLVYCDSDPPAIPDPPCNLQALLNETQTNRLGNSSHY